MKKIKKYYILILMFVYIFLEEILFSLFTYKNITIEIFLFSLLYSYVFYIIYLITNKKYTLYFIDAFVLLIFLSNYLYYVNYLSFIKTDVFFKSFNVIYFSDNILELIKNNFIIESAHPSPFSAYNGFFGSKPFSKCNNYLKSKGLEEIKW